MITIVDYGMGNLGSMLNMFKKIGVQAEIQSSPEIIKNASKLVLPGVGAFDVAMNKINNSDNLRDILDHKALHEKVPILGICLGMQILTSYSQEGKMPGLGWIKGHAKRFPKNINLKVPHMGWNIAKINSHSELTNNLDYENRYYFVHSYCVEVENPVHALMISNYGIDFHSAIGFENIFGVQFHPEKSHSYGMQILKNFSTL